MGEAPHLIYQVAVGEVPHFHLSWHVPELRHPDTPVLDVLATLLGSGRSSRLFRQVRERAGLAHSVDAWLYSPGNAGLLGVSGVSDGARFAAAREAILAEIDRVPSRPIPRTELAKAVKQLVSSSLAAQKTMQGQAQDLGANWLAAGDIGFSERYLDAVRQVTPKDLHRVARKYLTPENRTLYGLLPAGSLPEATRVTMRERSLELAADYLVMAAVLIEIKSRMLLPRPPSLEPEELDPRAELVRRLLATSR